MNLQRLDNVCNGGHLFNLEDITKEKLAQQLFTCDKAIAIVGHPPEINYDCDCDDCRNPEDLQKEARDLFDAIVATGNKGMTMSFKHPGLKTIREVTLHAVRVGEWSDTGDLYFIKTQPIE